jgi:hypothetical protein
MKILNQNVEILNKSQTPNSKLQTLLVWGLGTLQFGACLEFRVSDLEFDQNGVWL